MKARICSISGATRHYSDRLDCCVYYEDTMTGGYVLIVGVLLYILMVRTVAEEKMSAFRAAIVFTLTYFAVHSIVLGIYYRSINVPLLPNILSVSVLVAAVLQFVIAGGVFYKIESDDSFVAYMIWGGAGLALVFFVVPEIVRHLPFA